MQSTNMCCIGLQDQWEKKHWVQSNCELDSLQAKFCTATSLDHVNQRNKIIETLPFYSTCFFSSTKCVQHVHIPRPGVSIMYIRSYVAWARACAWGSRRWGIYVACAFDIRLQSTQKFKRTPHFQHTNSSDKHAVVHGWVAHAFSHHIESRKVRFEI